MSTNFKNQLCLSFLLVASSLVAKSQLVTIEVPRTGVGAVSTTLGPSLADVGPVTMVKDLNNLGTSNFTPLAGAEVTTVTFKLANQQYTGLTYSNLGTGLSFGSTPTTAVIDPPQPAGVQMVGLRNVFASLGDYPSVPGGPTNSFYTSHPTVPTTGTINTGAEALPGGLARQNGAAFLFTAAQVQYDGGIQNNPAPVPTAYSSTNKYYYGDLVVEFNRFVRNPVVHLAGLGGSYFYLPIGVADPGVPGNWKRTYFTTELQSNYSLQFLSGNGNLQVAGGNINNGAAKPDGASVAQTPDAGDPFTHLGAASGSVRVNGTYRTLVFRIYLRGADITDAATEFAWSAPGSASNNVPSTLRNPLTGDVWAISVSTEPTQLIPLPATGINLSASLTGSDVALSWKTLSELNSKHFDIERSTDGINFTKIGEKAATGYSVTDVNYSYADAGMNVSVYYYRLKLVDLDGKVSYSNIAAVRKGSIKTIKVFPNPAVENLSVEFSNAKGSYTITVLNQAGQEVQNIKADISNTVQYVKINRNNVAAGMYYVRVKENNTGEVMSEKVLIK
jgi:Secretion system C-terminal sorting domain